jgi:hypothetical protein
MKQTKIKQKKKWQKIGLLFIIFFGAFSLRGKGIVGTLSDCHRFYRFTPYNFKVQGWTTQIGLWAAFATKLPKFLTFWAEFLQKTEQNTQNIEKSLNFKILIEKCAQVPYW